MRDDFAIFILSHGRANNMKTIKTLERCGYTGKWYIICDNEDETIEDYYKNFGREKVIVFDKIKKAKECDTMDNLDARNIVLFARNSCHKIARDLGLTYFLELDDDYDGFRSRIWRNGKLGSITCIDLDAIILEVLEFLDISGAVTVAFAQSGDFITGASSNIWQKKVLRKAMNSFFCRVDRPFEFLGRINEDVNSYVLYGGMGKLYFTIVDLTLNQTQTQYTSGGLTESYLTLDTYVKSFYTVMCNPSCVYISELGDYHKRIHHRIYWENTVPKIISDRFKVK